MEENQNNIKKKIIHDIRNLKVFDKNTLNHIKYMSHNEIIEIIEVYNDAMKTINIALSNTD